MSVKQAVIRCPIYGSVLLNRKELRIIDSPFFQRLRHISQLGFASLVFPGAVHTRFSHSVGAIHLAGLVFDKLLQNQLHSLKDYYSNEQLDYFRQILRFSALLHDIGHPPFSHAAESLLPPLKSLQSELFRTEPIDRQATHEDFSQLIIHYLAHEEQILSVEEAADIMCLLSKNKHPSHRMNAKTGKPMIYPLLCQLISGEIDVDRMDYLLRDSYFAGVPYGKFDLDRLINSFVCCLEESSQQFQLALDGEGVPSYEIFLLARVHMFYQIYFHKSLGAYRHYLVKAYEEGEIDYRIDGSIANFLNLTETRLMEEFRTNRQKKWSGRIFNRIPAKCLIRVGDGELAKLNKLNEVGALLRKNGIETIVSHSANHFSSQIKNGTIDDETILVVEEELGSTTIVPLAEKSSLLGNSKKLIEIHQLYVHREDYDAAINLVKFQLKI
jgi:hypothetical protein